MAAITIAAADVHVIQSVEQLTLPAAAAITAGQLINVDSNGKFRLASAASAGALGNRQAMAAKSVDAGFPVTGIYKGLVGVGNALSAIAFDATVFAADTSGGLDTAAGTVSKVAATVQPMWGASTADKVLFLDM